MPTSSHRARRSTSIALVSLLALGIVASATACDPYSRDWAWRAGKTHGAIIETTAGRASLGIYRVPTEALYGLYRARGIRAVQGALWEKGQPPELKKTFSFRGHSLTLSFGIGTRALRSLTYRLIHDDPGDLAGGLKSAHSSGGCLALTLISYGKPTSNWTSKQVGCTDGSL